MDEIQLQKWSLKVLPCNLSNCRDQDSTEADKRQPQYIFEIQNIVYCSLKVLQVLKTSMNPDWNVGSVNNFENPKILCDPIIFVVIF